ncbi:hypothetical protein GN956_G14736 [Arapaima gigas]
MGIKEEETSADAVRTLWADKDYEMIRRGDSDEFSLFLRAAGKSDAGRTGSGSAPISREPSGAARPSPEALGSHANGRCVQTVELH